MSLIATIRSWFTRERPDVVVARIPPARVSGEPSVTDASPVPQRDYVRLTLAQAHLAAARQGGVDLACFVQTVIHHEIDGNVVELPGMRALDRAAGQSGAGGTVAARNLRLTPLLPFRGTDLSWEIALVSVPDRTVLHALGRVLVAAAELVTVPPLSVALRAAPVIVDGIASLASAGGPKLHLGTVETHDQTTLRDGYLAVVAAPSARLDAAALTVVDGALHHAGAPLLAHDHVLVRLEVRATRDDWQSLRHIGGPFESALKAATLADAATADAFLRVAIVAAWDAAELTDAHRTVVIEQMKRRVKVTLAGAGRSGLAPLPADLELIVAGADLDAAAARAPAALADCFADGPLTATTP